MSQSMNYLKINDQVEIIAGKDKGRRGAVTRVMPNDRVVVESVNMVKKHTKPNPMTGSQGGIIEQEASLHVSNVAIFNSATGKADRVGFKSLEDGRKVRCFKSNGEVLDA